MSNLPTTVQHICSLFGKGTRYMGNQYGHNTGGSLDGWVGGGVELGGVKVQTTTITTDEEDEKEVDR